MTSPVSETIEIVKTERSEVINLTWEVNNYFKGSFRGCYANFKEKEISFKSGQTIQNPCSWRFRFVVPVPDPDLSTRDIMGLNLELVNKSHSISKPVCAAFKLVVSLKPRWVLSPLAGGSHFDQIKKELEIPKREYVKGISSMMSVSFDNDWTPSVVEIRFETFNSDIGTKRNAETPVLCPTDSKMKRFQNKSKIQTFDYLTNGDENLSDFKIKTKDGKVFRVHKAILASQSPVFSTMFKSNMKEASSRTMEMVDLSSDAMEVLLRFIYSATVGDEWKNVVQELIYAGEKYELKLLIEFCDTALVDACKPENGLDLLKTARMFKLKTAEEDIKNWISLNVKDVLDSTALARSFS